MSLKKKFFWIVLVIGGIILLMFLANFYVKQKLQQELDARLQKSAYSELSVNIFRNKFSIKDVKTRQDGFALQADQISAGGFSYYKYLFKDKIQVDHINVLSPRVKLLPEDSAAAKDKKSGRQVLINRLSLEDGSFRKAGRDTASASFFAHLPRAEVRNVTSGMQLSEIRSYQLEVDTLYMKMSPEHYIDIGKISANNGNIDIGDFKIRSFFPRNEFVRRIPYEKDWITLDVKQIVLDSLSFQNQNDSLYLKNPEMRISNAFLNIYRDKQVPDDPSVKPLYSKLLREAPVLLNFSKVKVEGSEIIYEEQVKAEDGPATVRFAAVNGEISNLHNLRKLSTQPMITANADFMRGTPVSLEWTFPVFSKLDKFEISGHFGRLEGEALDPFLVPSLNARARGTLDDVYFNFYGNDDFLRGDFRIAYDEFKIQLLSKKDEEKKSFLSSLANLLVDNEQEPEEGGQQDVSVERTKNRSFWNFIWKGLRKGLVDALKQL